MFVTTHFDYAYSKIKPIIDFLTLFNVAQSKEIQIEVNQIERNLK